MTPGLFLRSLSGLLAIMCLGGACLSLAWGIADWSAQQGYDEMASWGVDNPVSPETWRNAHEPLLFAHQLDPDHPVYLQRLARLHRIRISERLVAPAVIREEGELAIRYLQDSINSRPEWGHTWAELALTHWLLGDSQEKVMLALEPAVATGPWEPPVIALGSFLGLQQIDRLDSADYLLLEDLLVRGLRSPAYGVFNGTFDAVRRYPELKQQLVSRLYPFLAEPWRRSVRYYFFRLADWSWPLLSDVESRVVAEQATAVMRTMRVPYTWLKNTTDPGFKTALCNIALEDRPDDSNIQNWCRQG